MTAQTPGWTRGDAAHEYECAVAALCAVIESLQTALKPLAFSAPEIPPPGVEVTDWREAVLTARRALAAAGVTP